MAQGTKISDVKLPVLKPENYAEWKIKITSLLKAKELWKIVGEKVKTEVELHVDYEKLNEEAKTVIYSSLDGRATQATGNCYHAYELWEKVTSQFEGTKDDITGLALSRFMEIRKKGEEKLCDFLGRYEIALTNLQATEFLVTLSLMLYVLNKSLPENIREGVRVWRTINKNGKIEDLLSYIRSHYRDETTAQDANNAAYIAYSKPKNKWRGSKKPSYNKGNTYGGNNQANNNPGNHSMQNMNNVTSCTFCKKSGHNWQDCYKLKKRNENKKHTRQEQAHMALERSYHLYQLYLPRKSENFWIIDSGATSHMTHEINVLRNYESFETPIEIMVGDGQHIEAEGSGWIFFSNHKEPKALKEVLYVPKMTVNLFSVKAALKDGYSVNFEEGDVVVKHKGDEIPAFYDGCLFAIILNILTNRPVIGRSRAYPAYSIQTWHKRLGHCGMELIQRMKRDRMVDGLDIGNPPSSCEACIQGKSCRTPHRSRTQITASRYQAILHFDTVDMSIESLGGKRYFVLATEEYSGYKLIDFVAKKNEIKDCVKLMINSVVLNAKRPVACIYTDNGTEFCNFDLRDWLASRGIIHELSSPYNAEQNGRAEAANKSVINSARTSLICSGLPKELWAEACAASVYVLNRLPSIEKPQKTRFQLYHGYQPNLSNLHEFGELALRLTPKHQRTNKIESLTQKLRFVGYTTRYNTYRLLDEERNEIIIDCNVRFANRVPETTRTTQDEYVTIGWENYIKQNDLSPRTNTTQLVDLSEPNMSGQNSSINITRSDSSLNNTGYSGGNLTLDDSVNNESTEIFVDDQPSHLSSQAMSENVNDAIHNEILEHHNQQSQNSNTQRVTRSQTGTLKPIYDPKSLLPPSKSGRNMALYSINDEPETVNEAKKSPDWDKWRQAMDEEIQALEENNTWTIVDKPPEIKPIKTKWIFKLKLKPDGSVERYKARLVAKGYSQIPDIDYKLTFAPVASMTTVRMMLAAAVQYKRKIVQFDIKTAFLYGDLDEELYMECPEYYDPPKGKVCKLNKSLYGLKQAPRQWHKKFDSFLKKFKLVQSNYDKCLYYSEDRKIMLTIYVDDGLIVAENERLALELVDYLKEYLTVKTMECKAYLGLEIIRKNDSLMITQRQYIERTLEKFGMTNCNPASTPEEVGPVDFSNSPKLEERFPFKELVGSLLYMVTCTRPDIAHAVSVASRTGEPTELHWACLKRILRYLKGTTDLGIEFRKERNPCLTGYSDADYANDKETRRSTSGFVIYWGESPIAWKCQRQKLVTLSTTEAEYVSGTDLVKTLIPLKSMMTELKLIKSEPVNVFIDNKSTVNIVLNEQCQERTKHIDVRHKWLNEHHDAGNIKVSHISGDMQKADILTKPLHKGKFSQNRNWLMSSLTLLTLLCMILGTFVNSTKLIRTSPVFYRTSDVIYVNKLERYYYRVTIMNPCESYFANITEQAEINKQLIKDCDDSFKRIARLDNCLGQKSDNTRKTRALPSGAISESGDLISSITDFIGLTETKTESKAIPVVSQISNVTNLMEKQKREKRVIQLLANVGTIVTAGIEVFHYLTGGVNVSNSNELAVATNQEREFLRQGYALFKDVRDNIHEIDSKIAEIDHRLNTLNSTMKQFPKIVALVNKYDRDFRELSDHLSDIDNAARSSLASSSIFKLAKDKTWREISNNHLQLELCLEEIKENKHFKFNYQFIMPSINPRIKILKAESFRFHNVTAPGKICWMKYSGPRYMMVNTTNNCQQDVPEFWLEERSLSGHPCLKENKPISTIESLYNPDTCRNGFKGNPNEIQIKMFNGFYMIYCYGNNITLNGKAMKCPEYVFKIPITEKFTLGGETYDLGEVSMVTINALELQINNEIGEQLKTDKVKIRGINTTSLDVNFEKLTRLTANIARDITIQSPIGNWLFNGASALWNRISGWTSGFGSYISIALMIATFTMLLPVLEIFIWVIKIIYSIFAPTITRIQRLTSRMRSAQRRHVPIRDLRRYLRDRDV